MSCGIGGRLLPCRCRLSVFFAKCLEHFVRFGFVGQRAFFVGGGYCLRLGSPFAAGFGVLQLGFAVAFFVGEVLRRQRLTARIAGGGADDAVEVFQVAPRLGFECGRRRVFLIGFQPCQLRDFQFRHDTCVLRL